MKNVELFVVSVMKVLYSAAFVCSLLPALADPLTLTWSGGASGRFSDASWSGGTQEHPTPQDGDTLVFANGGTLENDFASLSVAGLHFSASEPVTLTGKSITVANGGTGLQTAAGDVTFDLPLNLGSSAVPAMSITVAQGATNTFLKCVSGAADIVYDGLGTVNLRADSDYTGETTIRLGQIHAYADGSFGSSAGQTRYLPASKNSSANLIFHGITTDEPFDNKSQIRPKALQFPAGTTNIFNGTYVERSADFYFYGARSRVVYMGKASFENPSSGNADATAVIEYRGAGTEFGYDWFNGGNHFYYAPCLMRGGGYGQRMRLGEGKAQLRALRCENALLYDPATPAIVGVRSGKGVLDLGGFDQTFWYIDCSSANAATCITSALPSTVHLTLGASGKVVTNTCCATFKGPVSLSFEGSGIPVLLGTSSPATGSLSLSNGSDVTLLDGFGWKGTSLSVADGSSLTVNDVSLPAGLTLALADRTADGAAAAEASVISLNTRLSVVDFILNGKSMPSGTYGSSASSAGQSDDVHFSGSGFLAVTRRVFWAGGETGRFSDAGAWRDVQNAPVTLQDGDLLSFPCGGAFENDMDRLTVAGILFESDDPVTLTGKSLSVSGGGTGIKTTGAGAVTFDLPLNLGDEAGVKMSITVAAGSVNTFLKCVSGAADIVYDGAGRVNLRADSDYTGETTVKLGQIYAYADGAFGSSVGITRYLPASKTAEANIFFAGITTDESFDCQSKGRTYGLTFVDDTVNVINGTFKDNATECYKFGARSRTVFNGIATFKNPSFFMDKTAVLELRGAGTCMGDWGDYINQGHIVYYAQCYDNARQMRLGYSGAQKRTFMCADVMQYNPEKPSGLVFVNSNGNIVDMNGFDQTFWYVTSSYDGRLENWVTSAVPCAVRFDLREDPAAKITAAKSVVRFSGPVSLLFEGSGIAQSLANESYATGSITLAKNANVTLLDGFSWKGTEFSVTDGSTLTVESVQLQEGTAVSITDTAASDGRDAHASKLQLAKDAVVSTLIINGVNMERGRTYGSSLSEADVKDDVHFSGSGVLAVAERPALTLTWSGSSSGRLSDGNWKTDVGGNEKPNLGDTLVFPAGGTFENDIEGLAVAGLHFSASEPVTLTGKSITVANGGTGLQTAAGDVTFDLPLNLGSAAVPAMSITVAQGATNTFLKCVSGEADIVYDGLGTVNLRADSDYTGETTIKLGQIHAYADGSFGSSAGPTRYLPASKDSSANLVFHGITTDEPFDNKSQIRSKALQFPAGTTNIFNGTYVERSADNYFYGANSRVVYIGKASFDNPSSGNANATAVIEYRGAGTEFGYDWFNGGNHFYYAPCLMRGGGYGQRMRLGEGKAQLRALRCENALLYDPSTPAIVGVRSGKGVLDLGGFDQTFWYIDCSSANAATCITSALPSTVHLTLGASGKFVTNTCCATFKGPVSLSFEGSGIPVRLGTSSPATGSLSLSNGSDVTLLDGFGWKGTSLSVADGSVLKVGNVSLPKDTTLCIDDRAAASGAEAKSSRLILNGNMAVEYLKLNGKTVRGGWTYGSSESTADIKDDIHFGGEGVLRVRKPCGFLMTVR